MLLYTRFSDSVSKREMNWTLISTDDFIIGDGGAVGVVVVSGFLVSFLFFETFPDKFCGSPAPEIGPQNGALIVFAKSAWTYI